MKGICRVWQADITVGAQVPALTFPCSMCHLHSTDKFQKAILNRKVARFPPVLSSLLGPSTHLLVPHVPPGWSLWPHSPLNRPWKVMWLDHHIHSLPIVTPESSLRLSQSMLATALIHLPAWVLRET